MMYNQEPRRITDQERFHLVCSDSDSDDGATEERPVFYISLLPTDDDQTDKVGF